MRVWVRVWVRVHVGAGMGMGEARVGLERRPSTAAVAAAAAAVAGAAYTSTRDAHIGQYVHMAHARAGQACVQGWKRTVNVNESS